MYKNNIKRCEKCGTLTEIKEFTLRGVRFTGLCETCRRKLLKILETDDKLSPNLAYIKLFADLRKE